MRVVLHHHRSRNDEVKGSGNEYDYGFRIYDPRIARFLSEDPLTPEYPMLTPYQFASNTPIWAIDADGLEATSSQASPITPRVHNALEMLIGIQPTTVAEHYYGDQYPAPYASVSNSVEVGPYIMVPYVEDNGTGGYRFAYWEAVRPGQDGSNGVAEWVIKQEFLSEFYASIEEFSNLGPLYQNGAYRNGFGKIQAGLLRDFDLEMVWQGEKELWTKSAKDPMWWIVVGKSFAISAMMLAQPRMGDLTKTEIRQIQGIVNRAGRPLEVVGSAARGERTAKSDIDYVAPPSSHPYFRDLVKGLPSIDPKHGIVPGTGNPNIGPVLRFEPE